MVTSLVIVGKERKKLCIYIVLRVDNLKVDVGRWVCGVSSVYTVFTVFV